MAYRNKILVATLCVVILFVLLLYFIPNAEKSLINIWVLIGFLLSAIGILIAYSQIVSIKSIATENQRQITESIRLNNIIVLSDLSRKAAMVDEIQGYLRDERIEICILQMRDLKVI